MINNLKTLELAKSYRPYTGKSGLYVSVSTLPNYNKLIADWAEEFGKPLTSRQEQELHSTVMWSKQTVNNTSVDANYNHVARLNRFEYWDGHDNDGYLVAVFDSPSLIHLHKKWLNRGAVHSFSDYLPHLTLRDKFTPNQDLFDKIGELSKKYKGSMISFNKEQIESLKS